MPDSDRPLDQVDIVTALQVLLMKYGTIDANEIAEIEERMKQ